MDQSRLSIFVDESGDFGFAKEASPFYLFTLVFHNQAEPLTEALTKLTSRLNDLDLHNHCIHAAPLIRNEDVYKSMTYRERRNILFAMRQFLRSAPIYNQTFVYRKDHFDNKENLQARMARDLGSLFRENLDFFHSFKSRVLYYDNGQNELGRVLNTACNAWLDIEIKKDVKPYGYRLFQLADFICTLELISFKKADHRSSNIEQRFFKSGELEKEFLKEIHKCTFNKR